MASNSLVGADGRTMINIIWPCDSVVASKRSEVAMSRVLHRRGEWGRGRDLPKHRLAEISAACAKNGMTLYQALSFRRGILRSFPNGMYRVNVSSTMGSDRGQRQVATLFEEAVTSFVLSSVSTAQNQNEDVPIFLTQAELLTKMRDGTMPRGPTPDILFIHPILINGHLVKWIDAKLYYASAMLAGKKKIPNGKLQKIAERYNRHYGGKGAFVFGRGFCAELSKVVTGALLLDASPLDMTAVQDFQDAS